MQNNQSSYSRWSWIIALILALILLWMLLTGRGPSNACCAVPADTASEVMPIEPPPTVTEAFSFSVNADSFNSSGDSADIDWVNNATSLSALLAGGLVAEGDDSNVTLTGTVDSEEVKQQTGLDVQAFFGPDVTVDNQLEVAMVEAPIVVEEPVVLPPDAAKLYFNTGSSRLPADSDITLAPIVTWLNDHPDATVIIAGYHDPTGSQARNESLAKKRAQSAYNALIAAGIDETRIEMRKPASTEGDGDLAEARRVEVTIE